MLYLSTALKINLYHFHPSDGEAKLHGRLNYDVRTVGNCLKPEVKLTGFLNIYNVSG